MTEITRLREIRPEPSAAELETMCMTARERFVAGIGSRRARCSIGLGLRPRRRWQLPVLAGGLVAVVTATAAAALVLTSGPGALPVRHEAAGHSRLVVTAAWTVREEADGTVTIYLQEYADPAGLQQTLQADGVNAIVRQIPAAPVTIGSETVEWPTCNYTAMTDAAPQAVQRAVWAGGNLALGERFIIHPAAMPPGSALFLAFLSGASLKNGATGVMTLKPVVLNDDTVPACVPAKPLPTSGSASDLSPS
jgi:hypothetical protein